MIRDLTRFQKHTYDLIIVGGGINGAALAYMASKAGLKAALLEKNDFASGTSSKSSKLLHGGIRYLENFEFGLVEEALKERYIQYRNAPHLVTPLSFVIPVYRKDPRPLWMMQLGVWLYDLLSGKYSLGVHGHLSAQQILSMAPGIQKEGLVAGVSYWDAQMDDTRICLENVLMADLHGAHVANHAQVTDFLKENNKCVGVKVQDQLSGSCFEVRGKTVFLSVGPWTDQMLLRDSTRHALRLRPTKGVHILYRGSISSKAFLLQSSSDKRIFFVIPYRGHTLIGTTDTDYEGKADEVQVSPQDVEYLLKESARVFPSVDFKKENIITTFAGIRPLVYEKGSPSKVSRQHMIEQTLSGLWYVAGGKYTTYRAMAQECISKLKPQISSTIDWSEDYPLYGSGEIQGDMKQISSRFGVEHRIISYLMGFYGSRYLDVLKWTEQDPSLRAKLCDCSPAIRAQVAYACQVEMARTFDDVFMRRLQLQYNDCPSGQCRKSVEELLKVYGS